MNIFHDRINFQAGLNRRILIKEKLINISKQEYLMLNGFNIQTQFSQNKAAALANKYCLQIFKSFLKGHKINLSYPPFIHIYDRQNLIDSKQATNFCIPDTQSVLKNDYPFPGRSIFSKILKIYKK